VSTENQVKKCNRCPKIEVWTLEYFTKEMKNKNGLSGTCKECTRKLAKQSRAKRKLMKRPPCSVEGCQNFQHLREYCNKHYLQHLRYDGQTFQRTIFDKNEFEIVDGIGYIFLHDDGNHQGLIAKVKVDAALLPELLKFKWRLSAVNTIITNAKPKNIREHILRSKDGYQTQNISNDYLDCQRENLISRQQSDVNRYSDLSKRNISGFKGVSPTQDGRWEVRITHKNKGFFGGYFAYDDLIKAKKRRQELELKHWGKVIQKIQSDIE
jgi:hypothetical protein